MLLDVRNHTAERLQGKAYVAVLETVPAWPHREQDEALPAIKNEGLAPLVMADPAWLELAEDVAIALSSSADTLVWVRGARGSGKSSWLPCLLSSLNLDYVELDLRRESDLPACDMPVIPRGSDAGAAPRWPVLVLDNTPPEQLLSLMKKVHSLAAELVGRWEGPILMLGADTDAGEGRLLEHWLGRTLEVFDMADSSPVQRKAILTARQAAIEKQWNIELPVSVMHFAATRRSRCVSTPGSMLQWVERAAARLDLFARRGPSHGLALKEQMETLRRQSLVALAREEPTDGFGPMLEALELQRTATEVDWYERKAAGTLRRLSVEDLRRELERWVAARPGPVHYVLHRDHQEGDPAGAGPGNLHS